MIDTKQKILDTAERLFGEQGYSATSLRQIIAEAEVNVAAVHYHFGSKEELLDAVLQRKVGPVTEKRLARLSQVEAEAGSGPLEVKKIVDAFLLPTAEVAQSNPMFVKLMGRMFSEGLMPQIVQKHFQESGMRFVADLARALPRLDREELLWRVHFMIGAMAHTMTVDPILPGLSCESNFSVRMTRLGKFIAAGFEAAGEGKEK